MTTGSGHRLIEQPEAERKFKTSRSDLADRDIAEVTYEHGHLMHREHSRSPLSSRLAGTALERSAGAVRTPLISSVQKMSS